MGFEIIKERRKPSAGAALKYVDGLGSDLSNWLKCYLATWALKMYDIRCVKHFRQWKTTSPFHNVFLYDQYDLLGNPDHKGLSE